MATKSSKKRSSAVKETTTTTTLDMDDIQDDYVDIEKKDSEPSSKRSKPLVLTPTKPATFDNKTIFEPKKAGIESSTEFQSLASKLEEEKKDLPASSTALVVWKPPPPPRVVAVLEDQTVIAFTTKQMWQEQYRNMIMKEIAKQRCVTENNKIMLNDIKKGTFRYWKWFPASAVDIYPYKFKTAQHGDVREMRCRCLALQASDELTIETSLLPTSFGQLAPLGDFHPTGAFFRPSSLMLAKNSVQGCYRPSKYQPLLSRDLQDEKAWETDLYNRGMQISLYCPECPAYIQLVIEGFNPTGTAEEKKQYEAAFWAHARGQWKDDKTGKYPDCFKATRKAYKKCTRKRAEDYPKDPYIVPGKLEVIDFFHRKSLPKMDKKEMDKPPEERVQCKFEHVDVPIYRPDGSFIFLEDRPEIHAYADKDQTQFIDCNERSSIVNGEWDSLTLQYTFTYKPAAKDSPWSYGIHRELIDINKHLPPDPMEEEVVIPTKDKATAENTPQGRILMSDDETQKLLDAALDSEMLAFDIEKAKTDASTTPLLT